jgi:hypothetical protein
VVIQKKKKSEIILLTLRKKGVPEGHITWVWENMKLWLFCEQFFPGSVLESDQL